MPKLVLATDYKRLIYATHRDMVKAVEQNGVQPVVAMLEDARKELSARLLKLARQGKSGRYTYMMYESAKRQIEAMLKGVTKDIINHGLKFNEGFARQALDDTVKTLEEAERMFTGIVTPLAIREAGYMEYIVGKSAGSLLRNYKSSVQRYGMETIENIERTLRRGLLTKADPFSVMQDVAGDIGAIKGSQYKAERIVRTEGINVYNLSKQTSMKEAKQDLPDLKNIWISAADERTCKCCESLNNRTAEIGQAFICRVGKRDLMAVHPTIHPSCRCSVAPFREAWK